MANGKVIYKKQPEGTYTIKEMMRLAGVSRTTIYNYFNQGNLLHFKKGKCVYVYKDVFEAYMRDNGVSLSTNE